MVKTPSNGRHLSPSKIAPLSNQAYSRQYNDDRTNRFREPQSQNFTKSMYQSYNLGNNSLSQSYYNGDNTTTGRYD